MSWLHELFNRHRFRLSFWRAARRSTIILSAGMPRSGSTWLFNAARLLLQAHGDTSSGWIGDWASLPRKPVMLIKVHDYDPFLARHARVILYSYRDIRDALASSKRMFHTEPTLALARHWLDCDRRWREQATFTLRYESMMVDPSRSIAALARTLHLPGVDPKQVHRQLAQLDYRPDRTEPGTYDHKTLLHPNHITDGRHGAWVGWLNPTLLHQLEDECADWLADNGYPIESPAPLAV